MKKIFLFLIGLFTFAQQGKSQPDQTINSSFNFELNNYMGKWYEIARFDHFFERGLQGVTATYTLRPDGYVKVLNRGFKDSLNGKYSEAAGKAKIPDPSRPRNLKVSFFWIFYSPYNILELDQNYQYALIGSSSSDYLWILSRTPQMDEKTYSLLLEKARARGYDTNQLIKVIQPE